DTGLLRGLRDVVDVRSEGNDRLARSPARHPAGGNAGEVFLNRKAVLPQDAGQVLRRLELLEPELREAEDLVVHALDHLAEPAAPRVTLGLDLARGVVERPRGAPRRRWLRGLRERPCHHQNSQRHGQQTRRAHANLPERRTNSEATKTSSEASQNDRRQSTYS